MAMRSNYRHAALLRLAPRVRTLCITPRPLPHWSTKVEEEWAPGTRSWIPGSPPPRKLTSMITSAPSAKALVGVLEQHGAAFNAVHCGALWVRLGALARTSEAQSAWVQDSPAAMAIVREHTERLLPTFAPRQLANTAHGAAACGIKAHPPWSTFWTRIGSAAKASVRDATPGELKDLAWAFATAGAHSPRLLDALGAAALERVHELRPEELVMLAWSFAAQRQDASNLLTSLAAAAEPQLHAMSAREIATLIGALARGGVRVNGPSDGFFQVVLAALPARTADFGADPEALTTTAWALGQTGCASPRALEWVACTLDEAQGAAVKGTARGLDEAELRGAFASAAARVRGNAGVGAGAGAGAGAVAPAPALAPPADLQARREQRIQKMLWHDVAATSAARPSLASLGLGPKQLTTLLSPFARSQERLERCLER